MVRRHDSRSIVTDNTSTSEVVALVLVTGFVLIATVGVLLIAGPELTGQQESAEVGQAEEGLTQFDSEAFRVATGSSSSQRVDLGLRGNEGTLHVEPESGNINVTHVDFFEEEATVLMSGTLGTLVYEQHDTTVGYQGGGVWRSDGNGSVMVSPPEISFEGKTLTMPVIRSESGESIHSEVMVTREGTTEQFPAPDRNLTNKVDGSMIQITIQSRYCEGWKQFFDQETDTVVQGCNEVYPDTVTVTFLALPTDFSPDAGIIATSGPGEILLSGGGSGAYIDSYNSSKGPYEDSQTTDGLVKAAGNITMTGNSTILGDTRSGDTISVDGDSIIEGDTFANNSIRYNETEDGWQGEIDGEVDPDSNVVIDIPPINELIERKLDELAVENDNDDAPIEGNELDFEQNEETIELGPGKYYLDELDLQGETLILDASDNITIGVRNYVNLEKHGGDNSHIEVRGDEGNVNVFVGSEEKVNVNVPGEGESDLHFFVERAGTIDVPGDESPRFRLFGPDHFEGAIGGSSGENADVTAAILAPAGPAGPGEFYVQHGELFGAVVTGNLTQGEGGQIHFDRAIMDEEIPLAPEVPRLEYLYLTEYAIEVDG